jgi:glycosyltransferase involved in cell wall biosynthesis
MRVAIIHDWLTGMRGGEKCLEIFCELIPEATIFTLLHNKGSVSQTIEKMRIKTSFIQNLPFAANNYRNYLPFFPRAIESFNLKGFDFILSSSHCVAKGAKKSSGAYHLCYCYTPMRYVWLFFEQYFGAYPLWKKKIVGQVAKRLKQWDLATLERVDEFVAISETVKKRINNIYQRPASIIYPPVDIEKISFRQDIAKEDFYLCVSALVAYKRIDILIDAFNKLKDKKLIIVGNGDLRVAFEKKIISDKIKIIGWATDEDLKELYQKARAFVYPAEEDFGIAPVEAQAAGLAVIAYAKGGVSETVIPID